MSNNTVSQQSQPAGGSTQIISAEQVHKLPFLDTQKKHQFSQWVAEHTRKLNHLPPDNVEHIEARRRLVEFTNRCRDQMTKWRQNEQARTQNAQQNATQLPARPPQAAQQGAPHSTAQAAPGELSDRVKMILSRTEISLPPTISADTLEAERYITEQKKNYGSYMSRAEHANAAVQKIAAMIQNHRGKGEEVPVPLLSEHQKYQQALANSRTLIDQFQKRNKEMREKSQAVAASAVENLSTAGVDSGMLKESEAGDVQATSQETEGSAVGNKTSQQPNVAAVGGQSKLQKPATQLPNQQLETSSMRVSTASQAQIQHPNMQNASPAQQPPPPIQAQAQAQNRPQTQHGVGNATRSFPNTQQPISGSLPPGPVSAQPQPATSIGQQRPLTHQAAIDQAARSYSEQPQQRNTPQAVSSSLPQSLSGSAQQQIKDTKQIPIPKSLNVSSPQPVSMGLNRPTMVGPTNSAPGVMGQPAIPKPPQNINSFVLDGEGDRVLSKKKLYELVRQVTGGDDSSVESLTPEVEEAFLTMADHFVDDVVEAACRGAKLRGSSTLEIRDLQTVIERNYNIRIPGYATDDVRTVRKFQPSPEWVKKMQAVQAAKVMGGKSE